jgi:hypothetical protein
LGHVPTAIIAKYQAAFDAVQAYRPVKRGLTIEGQRFATEITSVIPCKDVDRNSIMITVAIPPDSDSPLTSAAPARLDGDYLNSCLHACWMLVDMDYPTPAQPMSVRFVGFSQSVDDAELSADDRVIIDEIRSLPSITLKAPESFLVISATATKWRTHILATEEARAGDTPALKRSHVIADTGGDAASSASFDAVAGGSTNRPIKVSMLIRFHSILGISFYLDVSCASLEVEPRNFFSCPSRFTRYGQQAIEVIK